MEEKKSKQTGKFFKILPILIFLAAVLWFFITLLRGVMSYATFPPIDLDTKEKVNYIAEEFHIKNTDNIGSYTVLVHEGVMTLILNDVKDIHTLCFENLAYYELTEADYDEVVRTEEEYNEMVNATLDEPERYRSPKGKFDGRWYSSFISACYNYWDIKFRDKSEKYNIVLRKSYEEDGFLRCEVNTGLDSDVHEKLNSME